MTILQNNRGIILSKNENGTFTVEDADNRETTFFTLDIAEEWFDWCLYREMYG